MRRIWVVLSAILAAIGSLALLLVGARRRGEAIGAAKAEAEAKIEHVEQLADEAKASAAKASEIAANPQATAEEKKSADEAAREEARELGDALLELSRRKRGG